MNPLLPKLRVCVLLFLPVVGNSWQVPADKPSEARISGSVIDAGSLQPLSGVEIALTQLAVSDTGVISGTSPAVHQKSTRTDAGGSFAFDLGGVTDARFSVKVRQEGYATEGMSAEQVVHINSANRNVTARFRLNRESAITGRVFDSDLERPVAKLKVIALRAGYMSGQPWMFPAGEAATTDSTGRFELLRLPPGDYYVETQPETGIVGQISMASSEEDREKTDIGYLRTYWPGTDRPTAGGRISLVSGGQRDIGDLRITKLPSYGVYVTLDSTSCRDNEKAALVLQENTDLRAAQMFVTRAHGQIPCHQEAVIRGVQGGHYRLDAWVFERQQKDRERAAVNIDVSNRNLSLHLSLERGVDVAGQIVFPESVKSVPPGIQLWLRPAGGTPMAGDRPPVVNSKGEFQLVNINFGAQEVTLRGLEQKLYIKDMIYNGSSLSEGFFRPDPHAVSHSFQIIISDKPAMVTGRVTDGEGALPTPYVVLVKWPPNPENMHFSARKIEGDENGLFRFDALAPGAYRLFGLRSSAKARLNEPNAIEQLVEKAQKLDLGENSFQNVRIEVLEF